MLATSELFKFSQSQIHILNPSLLFLGTISGVLAGCSAAASEIFGMVVPIKTSVSQPTTFVIIGAADVGRRKMVVSHCEPEKIS